MEATLNGTEQITRHLLDGIGPDHAPRAARQGPGRAQIAATRPEPTRSTAPSGFACCERRPLPHQDDPVDSYI
jgi:hypothetical protein